MGKNEDKILIALHRLYAMDIDEVMVSCLAEESEVDIKNIGRYLKKLENEGKITIREEQEGKIRRKWISLADAFEEIKEEKENEISYVPIERTMKKTLDVLVFEDKEHLEEELFSNDSLKEKVIATALQYCNYKNKLLRERTKELVRMKLEKIFDETS